MLPIRIKIKEGFEDIVLPKYQTAGAAACDLKAALEISFILKPGESALIPTGLFFETPEGYAGHITPRSGLALKHSISIVNSPGILDADYRGELGVILINHGKEDFKVERGDRIGQISFVKVEQANFNVVSDLNETDRGIGGFGSTGTK